MHHHKATVTPSSSIRVFWLDKVMIIAQSRLDGNYETNVINVVIQCISATEPRIPTVLNTFWYDENCIMIVCMICEGKHSVCRASKAMYCKNEWQS